MSLVYKPDWEQTMQNYTAWWNREDFGRCGLAVTARKKGTEHLQAPPLPEKAADRWMDHDYLKKKNEYQMQTTFYGGEAFPIWCPGYTWEGISTFLGMEFTLDENSAWGKPMIAEGELTEHDFRQFRIQYDSDIWKKSMAMHKLAIEESKGKSLPYICAMGSVGDVLAGLRSTNQLLYDMIDCPEYVHDFEMYLIEIWNEVFCHLYDMVKDASYGATIPWMGMWAPGKFYIPQNDFSYMISTEMYRNVFLDALERNLEMLDYSIYHVDGIEAFRHVDMLCELERLNGLQILPGDGKPSPLHFMDVLKRVQDAGKNLHISISPKEVPAALENLSSKGLFINTWCETEDEARELIRYAEKNSRFY